MRTKSIKFLSLLFIIFLSISSLVGCEKLEIESKWCENEIIIDGLIKDWGDKLEYIEDKNIFIGLANDENYLYMCFIVPADNTLKRRITMQGLNIWFDNEIGKNKHFGIHYPIGMLNMNMSPSPLMGEDRTENFGLYGEDFEEMISQIEILYSDEENNYTDYIFNIDGIDVEFFNSAKNILCEFKIPLISTDKHLYAIETKAGEKISLCFECPEFERPQQAEGKGNRRPPSGGMPSGGGMRGSKGGSRGSGMGAGKSKPESFKVWINVQLNLADNSNK